MTPAFHSPRPEANLSAYERHCCLLTTSFSSTSLGRRLRAASCYTRLTRAAARWDLRTGTRALLFHFSAKSVLSSAWWPSSRSGKRSSCANSHCTSKQRGKKIWTVHFIQCKSFLTYPKEAGGVDCACSTTHGADQKALSFRHVGNTGSGLVPFYI